MSWGFGRTDISVPVDGHPVAKPEMLHARQAHVVDRSWCMRALAHLVRSWLGPGSISFFVPSCGAFCGARCYHCHRHRGTGIVVCVCSFGNQRSTLLLLSTPPCVPSLSPSITNVSGLFGSRQSPLGKAHALCLLSFSFAGQPEYAW